MVIDYADNIIYGLDAGVFSLDNYTEFVSNDYEWTYEPGLFGDFGTGTTAILKNGNEIIDEYTILIYGDINGDSWYDGEDAFLANLIANGLLTEENIPKCMWQAADCNHDGTIDKIDVDLLIDAGLRKDNIGQNITQPELVNQTAYIEYAAIIDQSPNILLVESDRSDEPDKPNKSDKPNEPVAPVEKITFPDLFELIFKIIIKFFSLVLHIF